MSTQLQKLNTKSELHNSDFERAVLGAALLRPDDCITVVDMLSARSFGIYRHGVIFRAIKSLHDQDKPVDLVTLTDYLRGHDVLEKVGGAIYLAELGNEICTDVEGYCRKILEYQTRRDILTFSNQIQQAATSDRDIDEIVADVQSDAMKLGASTKDRSVLIDEYIHGWLERLEKRYEAGGRITGVQTGFGDLDRMTLGLQPSDLVIVAARPGMGKSAFAHNMMLNAALRHDTPSILFSLEMSTESVVTRMVSALSGIPVESLRSGYLEESGWDNVTSAAGRLYEHGIVIDDTAAITTAHLRQVARRAQRHHNIGLVVVDYLQLMTAEAESRRVEVDEVSRGLKAVAKELNVPIVALSQLSRAVETRTSKEPVLSDLRESGGLEQDADVVVFLYRDEYYNADSEHKGSCKVNVAKQRNGKTGPFYLHWIPETCTFRSVTKE